MRKHNFHLHSSESGFYVNKRTNNQTFDEQRQLCIYISFVGGYNLQCKRNCSDFLQFFFSTFYLLYFNCNSFWDISNQGMVGPCNSSVVFSCIDKKYAIDENACIKYQRFGYHNFFNMNTDVNIMLLCSQSSRFSQYEHLMEMPSRIFLFIFRYIHSVTCCYS